MRIRKLTNKLFTKKKTKNMVITDSRRFFSISRIANEKNPTFANAAGEALLFLYAEGKLNLLRGHPFVTLLIGMNFHEDAIICSSIAVHTRNCFYLLIRKRNKK